ncbi:unnamed protein product [Ceratitis capitata]|uniref:(Mediterranean fruit fly) hypothetical protein n=1 Tax=Ceratitis capitata TaxID=7213 RepID=A0A811UD46_CERCA|nr:unnamed protein product [Ceratitis capitata]
MDLDNNWSKDHMAAGKRLRDTAMGSMVDLVMSPWECRQSSLLRLGTMRVGFLSRIDERLGSHNRA